MEISKYLKTQVDLVFSVAVNEKLQSGITTIEFYKADDTIRTMRATLDPAILPAKESSNGISGYDINLVKVYDVEKQSWRSFKINRLKSIDGKEAGTFVTDLVAGCINDK